MYDEKAEENGRPEAHRSKRTVEEDRGGHRACEKGSQPEFQHCVCGEEIPRKLGNVRRADRAGLRPAPPSHRMGRSASAGLTPLRHSYAPSAHPQAHPGSTLRAEPGSHRLQRSSRGGGAQDCPLQSRWWLLRHRRCVRRQSVSVTSVAPMVAPSFHAMMHREKSSRTVDR